jgi:hypothetical protein
VPEGWPESNRRIPGEHDIATPPAIPDNFEDFFGHPRAVVMEASVLKDTHDALKAAYDASGRSDKGKLHKLREFKFKRTYNAWKNRMREAGISYHGFMIPLTDENLAVISTLSGVTGLTYPIFLFDGTIQVVNAGALKSLSDAMAAGLAAIETQASTHTTNAYSATTSAQMEAVMAALEA